MDMSGGSAVPGERKRLFLALLPSPQVRQALVRTQRAIGPRLRSPRPTLESNLHLTLVFLGECDTAQEATAVRALACAARVQEPFELRLADVGLFWKRRGSIVWRGVAQDQGAERLRDLQRRLCQELRQHGLSGLCGDADARYNPHVTLFRNARPAVVTPAGGDMPGSSADEEDASVERDARRKALERVCREASGVAPGGVWAVRSASLMWSHHPDGGPLCYDFVQTEQFLG
ncbi:MAG: RNA 2',3'-cyclic phosphodiesterase [Atopobiaceae bacterium]